MNKFAGLAGRVLFWLLWPALFVYLFKSHRTRVLIICGEEILVTKDWLGSGKWTLPGGGLHRGEDMLVGALREVREETGIVLLPEQLRHVATGKHKGHGFSFTYEGLVARLDTLVEPRAAKEVAVTKWLKRTELTAKNTAQDALYILRLVE